MRRRGALVDVFPADDTSLFACTNERNISLKKKLCGVNGTLYKYGGVAARRRETRSPPDNEAGLFRVEGSPVVVVMAADRDSLGEKLRKMS